MSLLEVIIAGFMASLVVVGLSQGVLNSMKLAKRVEVKSEANNFHQLLSLALSSSKSCLDLLPPGFSLSLAQLPSKEGTVCESCASDLSSLRMGGTQYTPGTKYGTSLSLSGAQISVTRFRVNLG
ncbi:MAG: hypothetical protein RJB38_709, partial [Pseudomonadota bacterium]